MIKIKAEIDNRTNILYYSIILEDNEKLILNSTEFKALKQELEKFRV